MLVFFKLVIVGFLLGGTIPSFSVPDLTIVGFFEPEGGIGKVPLTIIECLGDSVSTNFINTQSNYDYTHKELSPFTLNAINNPDQDAGRVALLTDVLWHVCRNPSEQVPKNSIIKLAYSMLETTRIPSMWVTILNNEFDAVVVPDKYLIQVYQDCGVEIPIFVLPIPMILKPYLDHAASKHPSRTFIFGDAHANKNPKILLEAFAKAFKNDPNVCLVLRSGRIEPATQEILLKTQKKYKLNNVVVDSEKIPLSRFIDLVSKFDCYINLSRGEGFSLIPREMLALGIPAIISNNTASTSICESGFVYGVPCHLKGPSNAVFQVLFGENCGEQFDCDVNDVITAMKNVYNNYQTYEQLAKQGRQWVKQYNVSNPDLKRIYCTLIKPKNVVLGNTNAIIEDTLITNSLSLYQKYQKIIFQKL